MHYIRLNQFSKTPLYRQLKDSIKEAIISGIVQHGDMLPSEQDIMRDFAVSATVVKSAYRELKKQGFILSYKGKGTFVHYPQGIFLTLPFGHVSNQLIITEAKTVNVSMLEAHSPIQLRFGPTTPVMKMQRVIKTQHILTIYQEIYSPFYSKEDMMDLFNGNKSNKPVLVPESVDLESVTCNNLHGTKAANETEASFLNIEVGSPLHTVVTTIEASKQIRYLVMTYLRGDKITFRFGRNL
jgi:DNA-binding GntR family transcriptional regulator